MITINKEIQSEKVSTTDPESGYYHRANKEKGFMYLDHRTVEGISNIIVDSYVTKGNVHDCAAQNMKNIAIKMSRKSGTVQY